MWHAPLVPMPHDQDRSQECVSDGASSCRGPAPAGCQVEGRGAYGWCPAVLAEVSPQTFTAVADALVWIFWCKEGKKEIHYSDDFIFFLGPPGSEE